MYPYIEFFGIGLNMTGLGIIASLAIFLISVGYLCKKYHQSFLKFFYFLPVMIIVTYLFGSYVQYIINTGSFFPLSVQDISLILSPKNYGFHFVGIIIGLILSFGNFFGSIQRKEDKKVWVDILFVSFSIAIIPLGVFLLFGDVFLGKPYTGFLSIKALHPDSVLNKFQGVYPVGVFLSLSGIFSLLFFFFLQRKKRVFGYGTLGFVILIFLFNIVLLFQQYPKYIALSYYNIIFDVKNYVSFFVIMLCFYAYHQWNTLTKSTTI